MWVLMAIDFAVHRVHPAWKEDLNPAAGKDLSSSLLTNLGGQGLC
jgi:hypothetical protein